MHTGAESDPLPTEQCRSRRFVGSVYLSILRPGQMTLLLYNLHGPKGNANAMHVFYRTKPSTMFFEVKLVRHPPC